MLFAHTLTHIPTHIQYYPPDDSQCAVNIKSNALSIWNRKTVFHLNNKLRAYLISILFDDI